MIDLHLKQGYIFWKISPPNNEKPGKINKKSAFFKANSEKVGKKYDFKKKGGG